MATHGMIDLETLDTKPSCTVLSVGAVKFNALTDAEPYDELYFKISVDDQDRLGRTTSDSTIEWWGKQDPKVMEEAFDQTGAVTVTEFLAALNKWIVGVDTFWGQGYGFDYTILENMYRVSGRNAPWYFWQVLDSRTLIQMLREDPRKQFQTNLHKADDDAYYQSKAIQIALKDLGVFG